MEGRETKESNDVFFVCSFIEYLSRFTKNTRKDIVNSLDVANIDKLYELADVYHCENIDAVTDEFVEKCSITHGEFDNISDCEYETPDFWDIGRVYCNLIMDLKEIRLQDDIIDILFEVYNSWITDYIDDYNSNMYYSNPDYIFQSYVNAV